MVGNKNLNQALEYVHCPLCGADDTRLRFIVRDRLVGMPGRFPVVQCGQCSFVYLNPRPSEESLHAYYPDEYFPVQSGVESPEAIAVANGLLARIQRAIPSAGPGGKPLILDVGCGTGLFLKLAREDGYRVQGIEPGATAAEYARTVYDLPVECGTLQSVSVPPDSCDVVTMWHVLEHMPSPVGALQVVRELLKPGGLLVLGVPNIESAEARVFGRRWFSLDAPRHVCHFGPHTARQTIEAAGLVAERIVHSEGTAGLVYSVMGDITGVSLRVRNRQLAEPTYDRIARALGVSMAPLCWLAARARSGGALEVFARKLSA